MHDQARAFRLPVIMLGIGALAGPVDGQAGAPHLSAEARAYLASALDTLEAVTLRKDTVSWRVVRDSAFRIADGAERATDTYGAIDWALHRANKHGFLQAAAPGAVSRLIRGAYGYVHVPQRGGNSASLADSLQTGIRELHDAGACGWIVDLRDNGGGNMWPMLAGIGPLLGDSLVGSFGTAKDADRWLYRRGMSGILAVNGRVDTVSRTTVPPIDLPAPIAPVAVLYDRGTGSSGEAIAIAFHGRLNTRTFGEPTAGFTTVNRGSGLPDGANMVVTTGYDTDRRGRAYSERLQPDIRVSGASSGWPFATDRVATAAADWLARQPACRSRP